MENILININDKSYSYKSLTEIAKGGEGKIYAVDQDNVVKVFFKETLEEDPQKITKVLALCDKYSNLQQVHANLAIPEYPATVQDEEANNQVCGFSMTRFNHVAPLMDVGYSILDRKYPNPSITDTKIVQIIEEAFQTLRFLHKPSNIILGDIHGDNILVDEQFSNVYFVDIDSAQLNEFPCAAYTEDYLDPDVRRLGVDENNNYRYSFDSDIYALCLVSFKLIAGVHPFEPSVAPVLDVKEAMAKKVNYLRFIRTGRTELEGHRITDLSLFQEICKRVKELQDKFPDLINYFNLVFNSQKSRGYFLLPGGKRTMNLKKKYQSKSKARISTMGLPRQSKLDPRSLETFLSLYNLKDTYHGLLGR